MCVGDELVGDKPLAIWRFGDRESASSCIISFLCHLIPVSGLIESGTISDCLVESGAISDSNKLLSGHIVFKYLSTPLQCGW